MVAMQNLVVGGASLAGSSDGQLTKNQNLVGHCIAETCIAETCIAETCIAETCIAAFGTLGL
jgi:hypothetical protein